MDQTQTLGQQMVNTPYDPNKKQLAESIKAKSAELIDLIQTILNEDESEHELPNRAADKYRLVYVSQQDIETACMKAVKACYIK